MVRRLPDSCVYCGCTEERACVIPGDLFTPDTTCAWVRRDPSVCSAPECAKKFRAETRGLTSIPAHAMAKKCRCGARIYFVWHDNAKEPLPYTTDTPLSYPPSPPFAGRGIAHRNCSARAHLEAHQAVHHHSLSRGR